MTEPPFSPSLTRPAAAAPSPTCISSPTSSKWPSTSSTPPGPFRGRTRTWRRYPSHRMTGIGIAKAKSNPILLSQSYKIVAGVLDPRRRVGVMGVWALGGSVWHRQSLPYPTTLGYAGGQPLASLNTIMIKGSKCSLLGCCYFLIEQLVLVKFVWFRRFYRDVMCYHI
jgi:hypothetical protein